MKDAVEILHRRFIEKRTRNPNYSMRSFARKLGVASGPLSEIIYRKRPLTSKMAARIAQNLDLTSEEQVAFLPVSASPNKVVPKFQVIDSDAFAVIADWYHYAILSLLKTDDFKSDPHWIAKRLAINPTEAKMALERLRKLKLIKKVGGRFVREEPHFTTSMDVPSVALRLSHKQALEQCLDALEEVPVDQREISSITLALDPSRLPEAKMLLKKFRRKFLSVMESGPKKEVYNLELCLIPLTQYGRS